MGKVSNETRLLVELAHERMATRKDGWMQRATNPNANSNNPAWLTGYEYAWAEWSCILPEIITELESK